MADNRALAKFFRRNPWAFPAIIGAGALLIGFLIWNGLQPKQGTWRTGLCRTFIEFEFAYPPTIDILSVAEERSAARIFLSEKNPFGNERIVQADCEYQIDEQRGTVRLIRMALDRKMVTKDALGRYNRMIPTLMTQKLDTALPPQMPRTLDRLKR